MHNSNISLVKRQKAGADIGNIRSTTLNGIPQSSGCDKSYVPMKRPSRLHFTLLVAVGKVKSWINSMRVRYA